MTIIITLTKEVTTSEEANTMLAVFIAKLDPYLGFHVDAKLSGNLNVAQTENPDRR